MDAHKKQISDIFNKSRQLQIPFYQRSYVWGKEQWDRFIEDMEHICLTQKNYFLGAVILKQQDSPTSGAISDVRTVIDGQQRLTTLCIYMRALSILTESPKIIKRYLIDDESDDEEEHEQMNAILHSMRDRDSFNLVMNAITNTKIEGTNQIVKAFNYFLENIRAERIKSRDIQTHVQFIVIDLERDENEQEVFDTINSLGVRLTTGELLKNYFFDETSKKDYLEKWYPEFENEETAQDFWDSEITSGRIKKTNLETLLYYYLQIKIKELGISSDERHTHFRRWDGLFENYKSLISDYNCTKDELINGILEYAKIYRTYLDCRESSENISKAPGIKRINFLIWNNDCTTLLPYVLYILKNVSDVEEQNKIFDLVETYIVRRIVANSVNKSYSDLFSELLIGENCSTFENLKKSLYDRKGQDLAIPTDEEVINGTMNHKWTNAKARTILYLIETKLYDDRSSSELKPYSGYSLEHLLPQNSERWELPDGTSEEIRKRAKYYLGNMALITQTLNASISNATWDIKLNGRDGKEGLKAFTGNLKTMKNVLNKEEWNEECIEDRSKELGNDVLDYWKVDFCGIEL